MDQQFHILPISKSSYQDLIEIWEASVRATHHFLPEEDIQYFKPLILDQYFDAVELTGICNAEQKIVGFSGVAEKMIEMLFIHPDYFRKGLGKKLVELAIKEKGINAVDVNEQNPQAVKFYQKMGFEIKSRSPLDGLGKPYPILHLELK
ncbi:GNAT family N-acetyltransferase [Flexithrix dorotheae]|uniref:GNAT family N-acetyltransferase n=1 Tax=Flexithrix dorotheae TaxID=70993 RepID=UPI0003662133|nr:GNAT family N-acetyltransferase [Flexithrix dorotheae]